MRHPIPPELPDLWRALADQQTSLGAHAQARTLQFCADQLAAALFRTDNQLLGLHRASQESGYSIDHLGRLLRDGTIPNSGRRGKPLIRRADLPSKVEKTKVNTCFSAENGYLPGMLVREIIHSKLGGDDVPH